MKWNWILIIFIILFVGLLIAVISRIVYSDIDKKSLETSNVNDFETLKSGDLVFVSYKNILGKTIRVLSSSEWSHVGMIYRESPEKNSKDSFDNLYVLEIADYKDVNIPKSPESPEHNHDSGVLKIPYEQWLKLNKHHDIYIRKLNDEDYKNKMVQSKILEEFSKLQKYKQQKLTDIMELRRMMFFENYDDKKIQKLEKITCIEFIIMMLQNLELMEKEAMPSSFYPCDLATNEFLKTYNVMKKMI
jgi:hypothetical protein